MSLTKVREADESTLIRYLVGRASEKETEQFDELSTVDEEFAVRLRAVEHDLLDAYVNGELTGDTLEGFRSQYLRSPSGVAAVELAEGLRVYPRAPTADRTATSRARARFWQSSQWRLAAATFLLATSAWLLVDNLRLRDRMAGVSEEHAALEQRSRRLQEDFNRQQSAARATADELARAREPLAGARGVLALAPPDDSGWRRDPADLDSQGVHTVILRLPLVAVEFAQYEAALSDAASDRVLWRSGRLGAPPASDRPTLPVTVGASLLEPRAYTLQLAGISGRGQAEPLDSYPFRVVP